MRTHLEPGVALVHDYLTQRGGAERVVLALAAAFPDAPLYTSLYEPSETFPEFADLSVRTLPINSIDVLRRRHRLALPLLAPSFSRLRLDADVIVCSSSGWAHGTRANGRKLVYCHAPARWLYQPERYLSSAGPLARGALGAMRPMLERWDRRAAASADHYVANSSWIAREVQRIYRRDAEVLHPPATLDVLGAQQQLEGIEPGFVLCVSRLLPYKNVGAIVAAAARLEHVPFVIVGDGPDEPRLRAAAGRNVQFAGTVDDARLRWLYSNASGLIAASYEDFGLTPIEAATYGTPTAALRFGGFLDTIREGQTGIFFDRPEPDAIATAVAQLLAERWTESVIRAHGASFSFEGFVRRIREIVSDEAAGRFSP